MIDEPVQPPVHTALHSHEAFGDKIFRLSVDVDMREVSGEDELRFDQGKHEAENHGGRDLPEDISQAPTDLGERNECGDGGDNTEGGGSNDLANPGDRGRDCVLIAVAFRFLFRIDRLADDDGIIDDDTEYDQKTKCGNNVHRHVDSWNGKNRNGTR